VRNYVGHKYLYVINLTYARQFFSDSRGAKMH